MAFLIIKIDQAIEIKLKLRCKIHIFQLIYSQINKNDLFSSCIQTDIFIIVNRYIFFLMYNLQS